MFRRPHILKHPKARKGLRETAPMLLAVTPLAASYGATGIVQGESGWLLLLSSIMIFAGSAQLMALGLIAAGSPVWLILFTTLVINGRHLLYTTSLIQPLKPASGWRKRLVAFVLNDETYALVSTQTRKSGFYPLMLASGLATWGSWILGTALGVTLGQQLPDSLLADLNVILVLTFLCLVVPSLTSAAHWVTAATATIAVSLCWHWPLGSGLLFASATAIACGAIADHFQNRPALLMKEH